jgi:DNA-binding IclR family transcriptional regulator
MNRPSQDRIGPTVKSAARCLDLLELLAVSRDGLTLTEIGERLGWPKSSTLALVRTMRDRGFLADGYRDRSYRLGPKAVWLGTAFLGSLDLVREGQEVIRAISRACDETVHLATLDGRHVLYLAKEEGTGQMRMVSAVGKRIPAHGTGVGKMLLAELSPEELEQILPPGLGLEAITARTITDRAALLAELAAIRPRGYATDDGESTVGLCCVAAPVRDATGRAVAAISISVPSPRDSDDRFDSLRQSVLLGAEELSRRLGWRGVAANGGDDPWAAARQARTPAVRRMA